MSEHTKGPWQVGEYDEHLGYDCMTGGVRAGPATLDANDYGQKRSWDGEPWDRARMMADARLIASAPEMADRIARLERDMDALLEALKWASGAGGLTYVQRTKHNGDYCDGVDRIAAAVHQAEAE